eukprot:11213171-Lingulodinium_polyedra.AAC.1
MKAPASARPPGLRGSRRGMLLLGLLLAAEVALPPLRRETSAPFTSGSRRGVSPTWKPRSQLETAVSPWQQSLSS